MLSFFFVLTFAFICDLYMDFFRKEGIDTRHILERILLVAVVCSAIFARTYGSVSAYEKEKVVKQFNELTAPLDMAFESKDMEFVSIVAEPLTSRRGHITGYHVTIADSNDLICEFSVYESEHGYERICVDGRSIRVIKTTGKARIIKTDCSHGQARGVLIAKCSL